MNGTDYLNGRLPWLLGVLGAMGIFVSYWDFTNRVMRLRVATTNLRACEMLAAEIARANKSPQHARLETWSLDDLGGIVERAAVESHIQLDQLIRIDPQTPKRLGKSDYLEQATEVEIVNVNLRQLVDFVYGVCGSDDQLQVGTLRLRMPHQGTETSTPELWLADVVLTQRIYQPTTPIR